MVSEMVLEDYIASGICVSRTIPRECCDGIILNDMGDVHTMLVSKKKVTNNLFDLYV